MKLTYDASARPDPVYRLTGVPDEHSRIIREMRWQADTRPDSWFTKSVYYAAPYFAYAADSATQRLVNPFAWNYASSFAQHPLAIPGLQPVIFPHGQKPLDFQVAGVQKALLRPKILLGDEPGLGKTVQAIGLINSIGAKRILIGLPPFLTTNWERELRTWLTGGPHTIQILGGKKTIASGGIVILPYSVGHNYHKALLNMPPFDYVVLDEAHFLKSGDARRSRVWFGGWEHPDKPPHERGQWLPGLAEVNPRVMALTGTPLPNNPLEMWNSISTLAPELVAGVSKAKFKQTYCVEGRRGFDGEETIEGSKYDLALNTELRASGFLTRRHKNDVLTQLPPKRVFLVHLSPTARIQQLVQEEADLYEMLTMRLLTSQELIGITGHISTMRRLLGIEKAPMIAEYIRSIFQNGERRVVLFMLHTDPIRRVAEILAGWGITTLLATGNESKRVRLQNVDQFQSSDPRATCLIGQSAAAGVGLTMTAACWVVTGEMAWTPGVNDQAIDRVHRITQTRQVYAPILTFPHGTEQSVLNANARKAITAERVFQNLVKLIEGDIRSAA